MLSDLLKRTVWMGLGAVSLTEKKAREFVKTLVEKKEIGAKEGEKLVEDLVKRGEETKKEVESFIEQKLATFIKKLDVATKADIERLNKKIDALSKKIGT